MKCNFLVANARTGTPRSDTDNYCRRSYSPPAKENMRARKKVTEDCSVATTGRKCCWGLTREQQCFEVRGSPNGFDSARSRGFGAKKNINGEAFAVVVCLLCGEARNGDVVRRGTEEQAPGFG